MSENTVQTMQLHANPAVIDLGIGQPQLSLLPLERLRQAAEKRFAQNDPSFLQYGAEQGDGYLRQALASFLAEAYGCPVSPGNLFITNGASQGLDLICTLFARPGSTIFVEEPSYHLALRILADHQLRPVAIPVDENGLVIEALTEELKKAPPALLYTIPAFQNPGGYTLAAERRQRLAQLSHEYGFLVVADEVYHLLNFSETIPLPLGAYTDQGNILSLGSFSKILAPGLRLGWIQGNSQRIQALVSCGLLDSGGGLNPFTGAMVRGLVENGGLMAHIAQLCATYQGRAAAMEAALRRHLPGAAYQAPRGGYFFWVKLPGNADAEALLPRAEAFQVSYRPGRRFSSRGGLRDYVRLCFAFYEAEQLEEGIARLGRALETC